MRSLRRLSVFVAAALVVAGCGESGSEADGASEENQKMTSLATGSVFTACDGWGFNDVLTDPSTPMKLVMVHTSDTFTVLGPTLKNYGKDTTNHWNSDDRMDIDLVVCFRETGRTKLDQECPLETYGGEAFAAEVYELELEVFVVEAATGRELGGGIVDAPFERCPFNTTRNNLEKVEVYGEPDEDEVLALVAPFLDN